MKKEFAISLLQQMYLRGEDEEMFLGKRSPFIYFRCSISNFDRERFENALAETAAANDLFRCRLNGDKWVETDEKWNVEYLTGDIDPSDRMCRSFSSKGGALLKRTVAVLNGTTADVHFIFSGLILDGMSAGVFLDQLKRAYNGQPLAETAPFSEYTNALDEYVSGTQYSSDSSTLSKVYSGFDAEEFQLPFAGEPETLDDYFNTAVRVEIPTQIYRGAELLAKRLGASPFELMMTVFGKVLSRFSGASRFFMIIPCNARQKQLSGVNETAGLFSNFLIYPFTDIGDRSFEEQLKEVCGRFRKIRDCRFFPGSEAVLMTGSDSLSKNVVFTQIPNRNDGGDFDLLDWRIHTNQVIMEADVMLLGERPHIIISYPDRLFDRGTVRNIAETFVRALTDTVSAEGQNCGISLSGRDEALIAAANSSAAPMCEKTLADIILSRFEGSPESVSVIWKDREYTCSQVRDMSYLLAERIAKLDATVAVLLPKSVYQLISAYAAVLSGKVYMPLDTDLSDNELKHCLKTVSAGAVITDSRGAERLEAFGITSVNIDEICWSGRSSFSPVKSSSDEMRIIINTSGTTGYPKSIALRDGAVVNCLNDTKNIFDIKDGSRLLAVTNFCHDMAIFDTFGIFFFDGCAVIPEHEKVRDPDEWHRLITKYEISFWQSVPSFTEMLALSCDGTDRVYEQMRAVVHGGEFFRASHAARLRRIFPNARLFNVSGPSETTIWNISHEVTDEDIEAGEIPIGNPFPYTGYHILDDRLQECPVSVKGKIFISGRRLAIGYVGNKAETEKRFITVGGELMYDSGDLGMRRADGEIMILGRTDDQVKIKGKRIELSGIESVLTEFVGVLSAKVICTKDDRGICAVYTSEKELSDDEIRDFMRSRLAPYMIPRVILRVGEIPLTGNGKPDAAKISELIHDSRKTSVPSEDEESCGLRQEILDLIEEETDCDPMGGDVNFFEIGGDSVTGAKIAAKVRRMVGKNVSVLSLLTSDKVSDWIDEIL